MYIVKLENNIKTKATLNMENKNTTLSFVKNVYFYFGIFM
jgi:hypothetical protein